MGWFSSLFGSASSPSVGDAMMGGTVDMGSTGMGGFNVAAAPDLSQVYDYSFDPEVAGFDWSQFDSPAPSSFGQPSDWTGTMGFGGADTGAPARSFFDPNVVGPPPAAPSFDPGGFQVAPQQAPAVVGAFGSGSSDLMGGGPAPVDDVPTTAWESQAGPWYGTNSSRADVLRSGSSPALGSSSTAQIDPDVFARQGQSILSGPPTQAPVGSFVQTPELSFGDKLGAWGRRVGTSLASAPGEAADTFARAPIATTAKLATTLGPLVIAGINASRQADAIRRAEREQRGQVLPGPSPLPVNPLPGTGGISRADLPAGSPMSPLINRRSGGFSVAPNLGLRRPGPQPLATGGAVGRPAEQGLFAGGLVGHSDSEASYEPWAGGGQVGTMSPPLGQTMSQPGDKSAQAEAIMQYLARLLTQTGR